MADEKLIFEIGFDLDGAVQVAIKDGKKAITKIQKELGKTPIQLDVDTKSLRAELKKLNDEWNKLSASQRAGVEGTKLREQYRALTLEANGYTSTLRSAVSAEDKATASKQRATKAIERQNAAYKTQSGYLQRLFQRMVAYASVTQAFSFLRNIREVTAEFELQRVALGSIIGDLNEANAMFEQIKVAAVKSPFQIKELVTYTKQLAAYKIESDELFETTQKLADVSAGLGVGMERLVLAYGQIRATGYLRASEVRQLNEAGIPIVEELAKKMSQLRGETVSAAEVMGLISERAISFGMVKEVFDDMTSAGGMFYKMQEKQAKTLAGQWSNLKDSISIMYEEIGNTERVNNAMKGMIGLVKSLAENWRIVASVLGSVAISIGATKLASLFIPTLVVNTKKVAQAEEQLRIATERRIVAQQRGGRVGIWVAKSQEAAARATLNAANATTKFGRAWSMLKGMFKGGGWIGLAVTLVSALATWFISARKEAKRLNEELAKIGTEGALQADQSARNFERLAKAIRESEDGSEKQTEALKELKRSYGDLLPEQDKEIKALVQEKSNYDELIKSIRRKIELQIQEQKLSKIISEYSNRIDKKEDNLTDWLTGEDWSSVEKFTEQQASDITFAIRQAVSEGLITAEDDWKTVAGKLTKIINETTDKVSWSGVDIMYGVNRDVYEKYVNTILDMYKEIDKVGGALDKMDDKGKNLSDTFNTWQRELEAINKGTNDLGDNIRIFDDETIFQITKLTDATARVAEEYNRFAKEKERIDSALLSEGAKEDAEVYEQLEGRLKGINGAMSQLYDFLKKYNALDLIAEGDTTPEKNPRIALLNEELSTIEKIYKEYQELRKFMSEGDARDRVADMFKDVNLTMLSQALSPTEMRAQLQKALDEARKMGDKKQILELEYKLGKFDADEAQRKLEKDLKKLSDDLSRTKAAKEFFDRMLGLSGDKELSATLTLSVYGTTGDDLKSALVKQVEQAFEGVDISGAIDYNNMAINYQKLSDIYAKNQDKILDVNRSMAESIVKDGQKTSESQIEQWAKELEAVKTYADKRVDIARQTQQRIAEIEASTLPEDEKRRLQEQYRKKEERDLAKLEYEAFKDSPMYVAMFDNLDSASTTMLNNMRAKLNELKESWRGLDMPTELKEMQSRLNEIDMQLATRNPFKALSDAYKGYQRLREQGSRQDAEQELIDKTIKHAQEVARLNQLLAEAEMKQRAYNQAVDEYGQDSMQAQVAMASLRIANNAVDSQVEFVDASEKAVKASQELVNQWKELDDVVGGAWVQFNNVVQSVRGVVDSLAEAFGFNSDDAYGEYFNSMVEGFSNLASGVASIGKGIATGDPIAIIKGISDAISGLSDLFTAGTLYDANREIEYQQELLGNLEESYDRLQSSIKDAFGTDYISNYNRRLANLQAQQEAYLKQRQAEMSKGKKADKDKIKEYEEAYREATNNIKDMQGELSEYFLGTDLTSAARDFANAWIDAYKQFGSTTDAMSEKFHDMVQNMVVESIAGKMMQELLRPVFEEIDKAAKDGDISEEEIANIANLSIGLIDAMDESMMGIMERLRVAGYDIRQSTSGLTGISKDIATASEESILGLASGINTQNFYISQVPPKLDTIIALLQGGGGVNMQDLITIQNQHLSYLPTIAQHTAETVARCERAANACERMADQLDRVIKPRGTQATHTVNTSL